MEIDANNPIVKLCSEAIKAEMEGKKAEALDLCLQAWEKRASNYDSCIVSHYLARYQETIESTFLWNKKALEFGDAVGNESVKGFFPSLYLNLGKSFEDKGEIVEAKNHYELASAKLNDVPDGPYKNILVKGISDGIERIKCIRLNQPTCD
jgi:hypothetical protein